MCHNRWNSLGWKQQYFLNRNIYPGTGTVGPEGEQRAASEGLRPEAARTVWWRPEANTADWQLAISVHFFLMAWNKQKCLTINFSCPQ